MGAAVAPDSAETSATQSVVAAVPARRHDQTSRRTTVWSTGAMVAKSATTGPRAAGRYRTRKKPQPPVFATTARLPSVPNSVRAPVSRTVSAPSATGIGAVPPDRSTTTRSPTRSTSISGWPAEPSHADISSPTSGSPVPARARHSCPAPATPYACVRRNDTTPARNRSSPR
ncbi:hypothetical protein AOZ06_26565 [Kibdelosporangium phytohabitans]|uniref:Uncharacterized protein n=1 Tax=Kibdelosporangium phytohabitans TaxID=860235 RepID=A0A0N9HX50_9PSEU|nr:hypothetical protein AOZ06_26565 [Kibdelosporangium phytohabitans]